MNRCGIAAVGISLGIALGMPLSAIAARIEPFVGSLTVERDALHAMTVSREDQAGVSGAPRVAPPVAADASDTAADPALITNTGTWLDPRHFPIAEREVQILNGTGSLFEDTGVLPLRGVYKVCRYSPCGTSAAILRAPMKDVGVRGVGIGGSFASRPDDFIWFTVTGAAWATGTVTIPTFGGDSLVRSGSVFAPGARNAFPPASQHDGRRRVVTPFSIRLEDYAQAFRTAAKPGMHFAPEPGTLALVGGGIALLLGQARRRAR